MAQHTEGGAQVTVSGFVYELNFGYGKPEFCFFRSAGMGDDNYTLIGPAEFEYTVPADFNPIASKIAAHEAELARVNQEYAAKVRELNERIAKLQAIENTVEEVAA